MADPKVVFREGEDPKCPGCGFLLSEHRREDAPLLVKPGGQIVAAEAPIYVCPKPKRRRKP